MLYKWPNLLIGETLYFTFCCYNLRIWPRTTYLCWLIAVWIKSTINCCNILGIVKEFMKKKTFVVSSFNVIFKLFREIMLKILIGVVCKVSLGDLPSQMELSSTIQIQIPNSDSKFQCWFGYKSHSKSMIELTITISIKFLSLFNKSWSILNCFWLKDKKRQL